MIGWLVFILGGIRVTYWHPLLAHLITLVFKYSIYLDMNDKWTLPFVGAASTFVTHE